MMSPFDAHLAWAGAHQRGRALLNRLTAAAAQIELLEEIAARGASADLRAGIEEARADLIAAARDARSLVDSLARQLPAASVADLGAVVHETIAPLRRFVARRETTLAVGEFPSGTGVAVEPELLRAAVAATVDVLLACALSG
jgi:hypothetical protein